MPTNLLFSDAERELICELIQREHRQLIVEIRHTDAAAFRHGLQDRLAILESTLAKFVPVAIAELRP
jgi:hypothetical protein